MVSALLQILAAYLFVDLATGIYHYVTDQGWNVAHQVRLFEHHHVTNTMDGFDWQPAIVALPAMLIGIWIGSPFLIAGGAFGIVSQVPHYYAHKRSDYEIVHHFVRILQLSGLIMSPQHHAVHHNGVFDRNFCIFAGWNNWWLNRLLARPSKSL